MKTFSEFIQIYRLYRKHGSIAYALNSAWRIAFKRIPF